MNSPLKTYLTEEDIESSDWSVQEKLQLVQILQAQCPEEDRLSYIARGKKINWECVHIADHSIAECQEMWSALLRKVRKHRSMREVLKDAEDIVQNPPQNKKNRNMVKYPDQPTRPLTPFFRYINNHRDKVKVENPSLNGSEVIKILSERWRTLSEARRSKYQDRYKKEWQKFQEAQAQFIEQHPELVKKKSTISSRPIRPSPVLMYISAKLPSFKEKHPEMTAKEAKGKLRRKYFRLKPEKKEKWVSKAVQAVPEYEDHVREYQRQNPDFCPPSTKVCLTKDEKKLQDGVRGLFEGAPTKPLRSAFLLYVKKKMPEIQGMEPYKKKLEELRIRWKALSEKKRHKYQKKLDKCKLQYDIDLEVFKQSLSPEDLAIFLESLQPKKKRKDQSETDGAMKKRKLENTSNAEKAKWCGQ